MNMKKLSFLPVKYAVYISCTNGTCFILFLHVVFDRKDIVKRKYNYLKNESPENSMQINAMKHSKFYMHNRGIFR
jgi:hypothetical protein